MARQVPRESSFLSRFLYHRYFILLSDSFTGVGAKNLPCSCLVKALPKRFYRNVQNRGKITALIVYVDDMIITGDDSEEISRLEEAREFEMRRDSNIFWE